MNRRDFIKSAIIGAAGVSVPLVSKASPVFTGELTLPPSTTIYATSATVDQPFWVRLRATGHIIYPGSDGIATLPRGTDWRDIEVFVDRGTECEGEVEIDLYDL